MLIAIAFALGFQQFTQFRPHLPYLMRYMISASCSRSPIAAPVAKTVITFTPRAICPLDTQQRHPRFQRFQNAFSLLAENG